MYKLFSVDDHIIEPADVWSSRVPARFRDAAPRVIEENGREFWEYEGVRSGTMGLNAVAGWPRERWSMEPARFADMIPGCYDPKERTADLLSQGILASVNFPTLPRFGGMLFNSFKDKDLADACVRAWNDFILEEWCPGGPAGLFVPMVICQVWDPQLAAEELRRCANLGARALSFVENPVPEGLPSFHSDHWDPLWAAAEELDLPVCVHIGSSGYVPIPDPAAGFSTVITLANVAGMMSMVNLLLSPVCQNFPDIKIVFSEAGIGWVPTVLERADRQVDRHQFWAGRTSDLKPSEVFRRNMYVCMVEEPVGLSMYDLIGADRIFAETDYPHSDTTYPCTQQAYGEIFEGIPEDIVEAVSHGNAERVFKWEMADENLLLSPDVASWRAALDADPGAAMLRRPETADSPSPGVRSPSAGVCDQCGKPVGAAGICPSGHVGVGAPLSSIDT
jgi:predicted TIM-barrel fold metal-dependent hydrolase